jgi:hypothetical protein
MIGDFEMGKTQQLEDVVVTKGVEGEANACYNKNTIFNFYD